MLVKKDIKSEVIDLLKTLIETPSFSKQEDKTADLIEAFLKKQNLPIFRKGNNLWAKSKYWDDQKPTLLLNSHHDTVKPVDSWTINPFEATIINEKIYGLGSNDAGGCLVALMATFIQLYEDPRLAYNLIYAATAEEEISGKNGVASILPQLGKIDLGIVGEPTQMKIAIAEKGLMVIDATTYGKAGHAAREEGENAILKAMQDIQWIQNFEFPKTSKWLGKIKCSVTQITAGTQHNVVPDQCQFVIDVRTTEAYTNEEIFKLLQENMQSELKARSFRLQASGIGETHPIIQTGKELGLKYFGSPTLSDQSLLPFPTIKIGPGDSARSHTADEFIKISEIQNGIHIYTKLLQKLIT
jgi:acetylornithine deacetylase